MKVAAEPSAKLLLLAAGEAEALMVEAEMVVSSSWLWWKL